jgi:hypothetical protein
LTMNEKYVIIENINLYFWRKYEKNCWFSQLSFVEFCFYVVREPASA